MAPRHFGENQKKRNRDDEITDKEVDTLLSTSEKGRKGHQQQQQQQQCKYSLYFFCTY